MTSFVVRPFVIEIERVLPKILVFLMSQKHNSKGVHFGKQSRNERITCSHNSSSWPEAILTETVITQHEMSKQQKKLNRYAKCHLTANVVSRNDSSSKKRLVLRCQSGDDCTIGRKLYNYRASSVNIGMKTVIASEKFFGLINKKISLQRNLGNEKNVRYRVLDKLKVKVVWF